MTEVAIGSEFAGHRIEGVAGRGGMGVVYRATHLALNRPVALKLITPDLAEDEGFRERFKHESMTAASIDHPNVIPIYHAGEEDGKLYITMRYVEGTDLRAMLAQQGKLDPLLGAQIVSQVAAALDAAHARGLVHRDVKPANVLIDGHDGGRHSYLTDFGLTKNASSQSGLTKTGMFVGTLDYIAPEQLQAQSVDGRADVYALGCVLYQVLTGNVPYPRESEPAKIWAHMSEPPPSVVGSSGEVPPQFEDVVRRAMAKEPNDRYLSAGDLGRAALAAAESKRLTRAERSVATGDAAPAGATAVAGAPPPAPGQGPTVTDQPPAAAPAGGAAAPTGPGSAPPPTGPAWSPPAGQGQQPPPYGQPPYQQQGPYGAPPGGPGAPKKRSVPLAALIGAGVAGLVLIAAVLAVAGVFGGSSKKKGPPPPPARLPATITVGKEPNGIAFGGDSAWVANNKDGTITRISQQTGKVVGPPISVGSGTTSIAFGEGFLWATNFDSGNLVKIDPKTGRPVGAPINVGASPEKVVVGGGNVWVSHFDGPVTKVSAASGQVLDNSTQKSDFEGLALQGNDLWVTDDKKNEVTHVDAGAFSSIKTLKTGQAPYCVAIGGGAVWVTNFVDSTVTKIDPTTNAKTGQVSNAGNAQDPDGIAFGLGFLWVADQDDNELLKIDPSTNAVTKIPVGRKPTAVAVGAGHVWVANQDDGTVTTVKP